MLCTFEIREHKLLFSLVRDFCPSSPCSNFERIEITSEEESY